MKFISLSKDIGPAHQIILIGSDFMFLNETGNITSIQSYPTRFHIGSIDFVFTIKFKILE